MSSSIGLRIKLAREALGLSQDELAKRLGYKSRSSIAKIEKDGRGLPQKKIASIAKVLETTPSYIMGWETPTENKNNIKKLRKERSLSLYEMASDLHIDIKLLEEYEKGLRKVPIETLEKISEYFNVPVDDIYTVGLITSEKTTLVTSDVRLAKMQERWFKEVGSDPFTDEEIEKLIEYAKFLKSIRKK